MELTIKVTGNVAEGMNTETSVALDVNIQDYTTALEILKRSIETEQKIIYQTVASHLKKLGKNEREAMAVYSKMTTGQLFEIMKETSIKKVKP